MLGIDPDVERPGVAIYDARAGRLRFCGALPLRSLVRWIRDGAAPSSLPGAALPGASIAASDFAAVIGAACVEDTRGRGIARRP